MTFILNDRVKETVTSTGSGTLTLGSSFSGYQSFSDGIGSGNSTYYAIDNGSKWEVGIGTYDSSNNTLTRDTVLESSNNDNLILITSSTPLPVVWCNYPAKKAVALDEAGLIRSFAGDYAGIKFPDGTTQITAAAGGGGGNTRTYKTVSSDETLALSDDFIFVDTTGGEVEITLPFASAMGGRTLTFKLKTGTSRVVIVPQGGDSIDSTSSFIMDYVNQSISVFSEQNDWYVI